MDYIISDIHGCYYTLQRLLERIRRTDSSPKLVFLGDYTDRGLRSKEVVTTLIELQRDGAVCLRGNHDDVIQWLLTGNSKSSPKEWVSGVPDTYKVAKWWCQHGLVQTMQSYGVYNPFVIDAVAEFKQAVQEAGHLEFFQNLPMFWENDTHFAVHAYMRYNEPLPRDMRFVKSDCYEECLWGRFAHNETGHLKPIHAHWDKIGVFGHTPVMNYGAETPIFFNKIRLIDAAVFAGGYLTAYVIQQDSCILQATDSQDIVKQ